MGLITYLHGGVVDDHGVELNVGIEAGNLLARAKEEAVAELHDVGLVHCGHLKMRSCESI